MASIRSSSPLFAAVACGASFKAGGFATAQSTVAATVDLLQEIVIPPTIPLIVNPSQSSVGGAGSEEIRDGGGSGVGSGVGNGGDGCGGGGM